MHDFGDFRTFLRVKVGRFIGSGSFIWGDRTVRTLLARTSLVDRDKFDLRFRKETKEELAKMREGARAEAVPVRGKELEVGFGKYFPPGLEFPKRPPWNR